jgi:hypothetical protein
MTNFQTSRLKHAPNSAAGVKFELKIMFNGSFVQTETGLLSEPGILLLI